MQIALLRAKFWCNATAFDSALTCVAENVTFHHLIRWKFTHLSPLEGILQTVDR